MEWLEIIELRSMVLDNINIKNQLTDFLQEVNTDLKTNSIKLFCSDSIETDFRIQIEHSSGPPVTKSKLGLHISMALKKFGLINHKIWIKIENTKR